MKKLTLLLVLIVALMSCEETELKQSEDIYFYDWDMTNLNTMIVENPIDHDRIINYYAVIYVDYDNELKMYYLSLDSGSVIKLEGTKFIINTIKGGYFDSERFDSDSQIRGHIRIGYY